MRVRPCPCTSVPFYIAQALLHFRLNSAWHWPSLAFMACLRHTVWGMNLPFFKNQYTHSDIDCRASIHENVNHGFVSPCARVHERRQTLNRHTCPFYSSYPPTDICDVGCIQCNTNADAQYVNSIENCALLSS